MKFSLWSTSVRLPHRAVRFSYSPSHSTTSLYEQRITAPLIHQRTVLCDHCLIFESFHSTPVHVSATSVFHIVCVNVRPHPPLVLVHCAKMSGNLVSSPNQSFISRPLNVVLSFTAEAVDRLILLQYNMI